MTIRRILIWLSVGCLTFLAGITLSYLWLVHSLPEPSLDEPMRTSVSSTGRAAEPKIVGGMDACGPTANYHTYTLSDGTSISTSCEHFRSAKRADEELRKKLKEVTEIIERKVELDDKGRRVGERIIAKTSGVVLLRVGDRNFCSTNAPSLAFLRWFEAR